MLLTILLELELIKVVRRVLRLEIAIKNYYKFDKI